MSDRDEDEPKARTFKVQDRRRFADVEPDERDEPAAERHAAEADAHQAERQGEAAARAAEPARAAGAEDALLPEMTFSTFVMGLTTQALMHLGEIADPVGQQVGCDLPAAKQMIDLLGILSDKTRGNLDASEEQLLDSMLYDLRMRYVEMARGR